MNESEMSELNDLLEKYGACSTLYDIAEWIETEWTKGPNAQREDVKERMLMCALDIRRVANRMLG